MVQQCPMHCSQSHRALLAQLADKESEGGENVALRLQSGGVFRTRDAACQAVTG